jgi:error-prone DNA polymerase
MVHAGDVLMASSSPGYAELQVQTNFSFLRGGSHAHELVERAKALGHRAIAVCDRNTFAGVVRAHTAAEEAGIQLIVGVRLDLEDGPSLLAFPKDRAGYGRLSRLLSIGQGRSAKGACTLYLDDVARLAEGQVFVVLAPEAWCWMEVLEREPADAVAFGGEEAKIIAFPGCDCAVSEASGVPTQTAVRGGLVIGSDGQADTAGYLEEELIRVRNALGGEDFYLAVSHLYRGDDRARIEALAQIAERAGVAIVATNDVLYHAPERRPLQDVLTCIREKTTIAAAGRLLAANGERHLKAPREMARLFRGYEEALYNTLRIAAACQFSLSELAYEYPKEPVPAGETAQSQLEKLAWEGAGWRFPDGLPDKIRGAIARELAIIAELSYAPYFLTVHDIVSFARGLGILCQGRGSAANSVVCYCLGITAVNPSEVDLLFERFVSPERKEPPDIDVDFEHERREEVIQYIYRRYGRERAGLAATVISYRARSAVREVGKAMGLSEDTVAALAGMVWGVWGQGGVPEKHVREAGLDPGDPLLGAVLELTATLVGFPRHLSQHVGGFVLTRGPLVEVVPVGNAAMAERTFIEWDKDDLDALGLLKIDILALGMLSCIRRAFDLIALHHDKRLSLACVPREDPAVYDMLCRADSIGVFQVESRAQMNMLPRLKPRTYYDLVIEVAIVRPGPIQGDMVHPYLRRRDGLEPEVYPSPAPEHGPPDELRQILAKTKGVPLFQEQAMRIAMVAAKFSNSEVNELRRALATFRRRGTIHTLEEKMVSRMVARGYDPEFAARCFNQIKGFGEYGFPESHAASFAHLVYVSSWIKCHYPAAFCAAILNAQPMGFYAPAQLVRDACEHGVEVRPVDVNFSDWDATLEATENDGDVAVRLGLRQVDGLRRDEAERIIAARQRDRASGQGQGQGDGVVVFDSVETIMRRAGISRATLERLAAADAFRSIARDRREALWDVSGLPVQGGLPLFGWANESEAGRDEAVALPEMALSEHVVNDYQTLRLSLKAHPVSFLRDRLREERILSSADIRGLGNWRRVKVAGVVLVRQRPGSAKGVVFMTIEDETGVANVVVWPKVLERYRKVIMTARLIEVRGTIQRHEDIIHIVAGHLEDRNAWLGLLTEAGGPMQTGIARADEVVRPGPDPATEGMHPRWAGHPRNERVLPKSRDFH